MVHSQAPWGYVSLIFCQCPFESNDAVQVAVGDMVSDLPNRPVLVKRIELLLTESKDSLPKSCWGQLDFLNKLFQDS